MLATPTDVDIDQAWARATILSKEGRTRDALAIYVAIAKALQSSRGTVPPIELCERIARACASLGAFELAIVIVGAARDAVTALKTAASARTARHLTFVLCQLATRAGEVESARAFLSQAASPDSLPLDRFERSLCLAMMAAADGRFGTAIAAYEDALAIEDRTVSAFYELSDVALRRAQASIDRGDFAAAGAAVERELTEGRESAPWRLLQAQLLRLHGKYSEALESFGRARANIRGDDVEGVGVQADLGRAFTLIGLNRLRDAEAVLRSLHEASASDLRVDASLVATLAEYVARRRRARPADLALPFVPEQALEPAVGLAPESGALPGPDAPLRRTERLSADWNRAANVVLSALARGDVDAAEGLLPMLQGPIAATDSDWLRARLAQVTALVLYYRRSYGPALEAARVALAFAEQRGLRHHAWESARLVAWCEANQAHPEQYAAASERARTHLDTLLGSLQPDDRVFYLLNKSNANDEYSSAILRKAHADAAALDEVARARRAGVRGWLERWRARRQRRRVVSEVHRRIGAMLGWSVARAHGREQGFHPRLANTPDEIEAWLGEKLAELESARVLGAGALPGRWLSAHLRSDSAVAHYHVAPDAVHVFVTWRKEQVLLRKEITRVELDEQVRDLRRTLDSHRVETAAGGRVAKRAETELRQQVEALSSTLVVSALNELLPARVRHLTVVPHDVLTNVPWALLSVGARPLCTRFDVSVVPSIQWVRCSRRSWRTPRAALVVAVSRFEHEELRDAPLPAAAKEAELVLAALGTRATPLLEESATGEQVEQALGGVGWAHFATHGCFSVDEPARSYLALAKGGSLRLDRLRTLDLRRLRGLVVSACEVSLHAVLPGQELIGFPSALLLAGVENVVAPLWKVEDDLALEFTSDLYSALKVMAPGPALASVQAAWSAHESPVKRAPRSWAGYVLVAG